MTPKRVTSLLGLSTRYALRATQLLSKKRGSGGEELAALCPTCPAQDLNLRPSVSETNAFPLDQMISEYFGLKRFFYFYSNVTLYLLSTARS